MEPRERDDRWSVGERLALYALIAVAVPVVIVGLLILLGPWIATLLPPPMINNP